MKKNLLFVFPFVLCVINGYSQDSVRRELPPFTALLVTDKMTVRLHKAEKESVSIQTEGLPKEQVQTMVENNTLKLNLAGGIYTKQKVRIDLYFKEIREIEIRNDADVITASLFKADSLSVILKFGGSLYLDADLGYLNSNVSGGGLLTAEGYAVRHDIVVSSRSTVSAFNLESESVRVEATSGGKAKISVDSELDARATTGAYISYKGNPARKNIDASSGTEVVAGEE